MAFTGNYSCDIFRTGLLTGTFDFSTDVFKIALYTNEATLNAETESYSSENEVSGSGYSPGGMLLTPTVAASGTVSYVTFSDVTVDAALTARGALVYKVGGSNPAVCVLDFGSDKSSTTAFTIIFPVATETTALLRIA